MISILFAEFAIIPLIEALTVYKSVNLKKLQDNLIPVDFNVDDITTADVLFPTWNLDESEPELFSKAAKDKLGNIIP